MATRGFNDADRAKKKSRVTGEAQQGPVPQNVLEAVRAGLVNGYLPCPVAFEMARKLRVPLARIGQSADELGVRVVDCQLGCFKVDKAVHGEKKAMRDDVSDAVSKAASPGPLTCAESYALARRLKVPVREIGDAASVKGIKIRRCQLGCF